MNRLYKNINQLVLLIFWTSLFFQPVGLSSAVSVTYRSQTNKNLRNSYLSPRRNFIPRNFYSRKPKTSRKNRRTGSYYSHPKRRRNSYTGNVSRYMGGGRNTYRRTSSFHYGGAAVSPRALNMRKPRKNLSQNKGGWFSDNGYIQMGSGSDGYMVINNDPIGDFLKDIESAKLERDIAFGSEDWWIIAAGIGLGIVGAGIGYKFGGGASGAMYGGMMGGMGGLYLGTGINYAVQKSINENYNMTAFQKNLLAGGAAGAITGLYFGGGKGLIIGATLGTSASIGAGYLSHNAGYRYDMPSRFIGGSFASFGNFITFGQVEALKEYERKNAKAWVQGLENNGYDKRTAARIYLDVIKPITDMTGFMLVYMGVAGLVQRGKVGKRKYNKASIDDFDAFEKEMKGKGFSVKELKKGSIFKGREFSGEVLVYKPVWRVTLDSIKSAVTSKSFWRKVLLSAGAAVGGRFALGFFQGKEGADLVSYGTYGILGKGEDGNVRLGSPTDVFIGSFNLFNDALFIYTLASGIGSLRKMKPTSVVDNVDDYGRQIDKIAGKYIDVADDAANASSNVSKAASKVDDIADASSKISKADDISGAASGADDIARSSKKMAGKDVSVDGGEISKFADKSGKISKNLADKGDGLGRFGKMKNKFGKGMKKLKVAGKKMGKGIKNWGVDVGRSYSSAFEATTIRIANGQFILDAAKTGHMVGAFNIVMQPVMSTLAVNLWKAGLIDRNNFILGSIIGQLEDMGIKKEYLSYGIYGVPTSLEELGSNYYRDWRNGLVFGVKVSAFMPFISPAISNTIGKLPVFKQFFGRESLFNFSNPVARRFDQMIYEEMIKENVIGLALGRMSGGSLDSNTSEMLEETLGELDGTPGSVMSSKMIAEAIARYSVIENVSVREVSRGVSSVVEADRIMMEQHGVKEKDLQTYEGRIRSIDRTLSSYEEGSEEYSRLVEARKFLESIKGASVNNQQFDEFLNKKGKKYSINEHYGFLLYAGYLTQAQNLESQASEISKKEEVTNQDRKMAKALQLTSELMKLRAEASITTSREMAVSTLKNMALLTGFGTGSEQLGLISMATLGQMSMKGSKLYKRYSEIQGELHNVETAMVSESVPELGEVFSSEELLRDFSPSFRDKLRSGFESAKRSVKRESKTPYNERTVEDLSRKIHVISSFLAKHSELEQSADRDIPGTNLNISQVEKIAITEARMALDLYRQKFVQELDKVEDKAMLTTLLGKGTISQEGKDIISMHLDEFTSREDIRRAVFQQIDTEIIKGFNPGSKEKLDSISIKVDEDGRVRTKTYNLSLPIITDILEKALIENSELMGIKEVGEMVDEFRMMRREVSSDKKGEIDYMALSLYKSVVDMYRSVDVIEMEKIDTFAARVDKSIKNLSSSQSAKEGKDIRERALKILNLQKALLEQMKLKKIGQKVNAELELGVQKRAKEKFKILDELVGDTVLEDENMESLRKRIKQIQDAISKESEKIAKREKVSVEEAQLAARKEVLESKPRELRRIIDVLSAISKFKGQVVDEQILSACHEVFSEVKENVIAEQAKGLKEKKGLSDRISSLFKKSKSQEKIDAGKQKQQSKEISLEKALDGLTQIKEEDSVSEVLRRKMDLEDAFQEEILAIAELDNNEDIEKAAKELGRVIGEKLNLSNSDIISADILSLVKYVKSVQKNPEKAEFLYREFIEPINGEFRRQFIEGIEIKKGGGNLEVFCNNGEYSVRSKYKKAKEIVMGRKMSNYARMLNRVIRDFERDKGVILSKEQVEILIDMVFSIDSAFEIPTGTGKTEIITSLYNRTLLKLRKAGVISFSHALNAFMDWAKLSDAFDRTALSLVKYFIGEYGADLSGKFLFITDRRDVETMRKKVKELKVKLEILTEAKKAIDEGTVDKWLETLLETLKEGLEFKEDGELKDEYRNTEKGKKYTIARDLISSVKDFTSSLQELKDKFEIEFSSVKEAVEEAREIVKDLRTKLGEDAFDNKSGIKEEWKKANYKKKKDDIEKYELAQKIVRLGVDIESAPEILKAIDQGIFNISDLNSVTEEEIEKADIIYSYVSAISFAKAWGKKEGKLEVYKKIVSNAYLLQDEFHTAITDTTPHIVSEGMDVSISDDIRKVTNEVDIEIRKLMERVIKGEVEGSIPEVDETHRRGNEFSAEEVNEFIRMNLIQNKETGEFKFSDEFLEEAGLKKKGKEIDKRINAALNARITATQKMGLGQDFAVVIRGKDGEVKIVDYSKLSEEEKKRAEIIPIHNGPAPNMKYSNPYLVCALEFVAKGRAAVSKVNKGIWDGLSISPNSIQATWNEVLTDVIRSGGSVIGMTGTISDKHNIVEYSYSVRLAREQSLEKKYFEAEKETSISKRGKVHFTSQQGYKAVEHIVTEVVKKKGNYEDGLIFVAEAKMYNLTKAQELFAEGLSKEGFRVVKRDADGTFWEYKGGKWENVSVQEVTREMFTEKGEKPVALFVDSSGIEGLDIKIGKGVNTRFIHMIDSQNTTMYQALQGFGRDREVHEMEIFVTGVKNAKEMNGLDELKRIEELKKILTQNAEYENERVSSLSKTRSSLYGTVNNLLMRLLENAETQAEIEAIKQLMLKINVQQFEDVGFGVLSTEESLNNTLNFIKSFLRANLTSATKDGRNFRKKLSEENLLFLDTILESSLSGGYRISVEEKDDSAMGGVYRMIEKTLFSSVDLRATVAIINEFAAVKGSNKEKELKKENKTVITLPEKTSGSGGTRSNEVMLTSEQLTQMTQEEVTSETSGSELSSEEEVLIEKESRIERKNSPLKVRTKMPVVGMFDIWILIKRLSEQIDDIVSAGTLLEQVQRGIFKLVPGSFWDNASYVRAAYDDTVTEMDRKGIYGDFTGEEKARKKEATWKIVKEVGKRRGLTEDEEMLVYVMITGDKEKFDVLSEKFKEFDSEMTKPLSHLPIFDKLLSLDGVIRAIGEGISDMEYIKNAGNVVKDSILKQAVNSVSSEIEKIENWDSLSVSEKKQVIDSILTDETIENLGVEKTEIPAFRSALYMSTIKEYAEGLLRGNISRITEGVDERLNLDALSESAKEMSDRDWSKYSSKKLIKKDKKDKKRQFEKGLKQVSKEIEKREDWDSLSVSEKKQVIDSVLDKVLSEADVDSEEYEIFKRAMYVAAIKDVAEEVLDMHKRSDNLSGEVERVNSERGLILHAALNEGIDSRNITNSEWIKILYEGGYLPKGLEKFIDDVGLIVQMERSEGESVRVTDDEEEVKLVKRIAFYQQGGQKKVVSKKRGRKKQHEKTAQKKYKALMKRFAKRIGVSEQDIKDIIILNDSGEGIKYKVVYRKKENQDNPSKIIRGIAREKGFSNFEIDRVLTLLDLDVARGVLDNFKSSMKNKAEEVEHGIEEFIKNIEGEIKREDIGKIEKTSDWIRFLLGKDYSDIGTMKALLFRLMFRKKSYKK